MEQSCYGGSVDEKNGMDENNFFKALDGDLIRILWLKNGHEILKKNHEIDKP